MKRLNKVQKEVEGLAKRVPCLTDAQKKWGANQFSYFVRIRSCDEHFRCPSCGTKIPSDYLKEKGGKWNGSDYNLRCPHCGARLQVRKDYDWRGRYNMLNHQEDFFQVMNVVGDWQVTRLIYMQRYCYTRKPSTDWEFVEVCQAWNNPKQDKTLFRAYPKKGCMARWAFNPYSLGWNSCRVDEQGHFLKDEKGRYLTEWKPNGLEMRMAGSSNHFGTTAIYPRATILPYYKQRGLTAKRLYGDNAMRYFEMLSEKNYKPLYETLFKADAVDILDIVTSRAYQYNGNADAVFSAWKICQRNHYNYKQNFTEWKDLVCMLREQGKDYRNPYYVCPADLHAMHQRMIDAREKKQREEELKKKMQNDRNYRKRIAKYLDMDIHDEDISVIVLPNIRAFYDEAAHLHHCVYRCNYFDKADSLILSARDESGKRWETIEVSLRSFKIVQSYGYGDKFTERHDEITQLVERNMWQIRERRQMRKAS